MRYPFTIGLILGAIAVIANRRALLFGLKGGAS